MNMSLHLSLLSHFTFVGYIDLTELQPAASLSFQTFHFNCIFSYVLQTQSEMLTTFNTLDQMCLQALIGCFC